ncbi:MAG: TIGR04211 family SH3 domain-containing protein [Oligoflexales bacterium]|nr:TIGR04211 family SH3 domain-containing protein [Oligoflexales bacterium]
MKIFLSFCLIFASSVAVSAVRYVTDLLYVPIRSGASNDTSVVKVVKSGDTLTLIENGQGGFSKVKTREGDEGWISSKYLVDTPAAKDQLPQLTAQLKSVSKDQGSLTGTIEKLQNDLKTLRSENGIHLAQNEKLKTEVEKLKKISESPLKISEANEALKAENSKLLLGIQELKDINIKLADNNKNEGMKLGIGSVLLGLCLGVFLPYLTPSRKRQAKGIRLR